MGFGFYPKVKPCPLYLLDTSSEEEKERERRGPKWRKAGLLRLAFGVQGARKWRMVVVTRAGCRAALFLWIFISISCRARTALPASRKYPFLRNMHNFSSAISQREIPTTLWGWLFFLCWWILCLIVFDFSLYASVCTEVWYCLQCSSSDLPWWFQW